MVVLFFSADRSEIAHKRHHDCLTSTDAGSEPWVLDMSSVVTRRVYELCCCGVHHLLLYNQCFSSEGANSSKCHLIPASLLGTTTSCPPWETAHANTKKGIMSLYPICFVSLEIWRQKTTIPPLRKSSQSCSSCGSCRPGVRMDWSCTSAPSPLGQPRGHVVLSVGCQPHAMLVLAPGSRSSGMQGHLRWGFWVSPCLLKGNRGGHTAAEGQTCGGWCGLGLQSTCTEGCGALCTASVAQQELNSGSGGWGLYVSQGDAPKLVGTLLRR